MMLLVNAAKKHQECLSGASGSGFIGPIGFIGFRVKGLDPVGFRF